MSVIFTLAYCHRGFNLKTREYRGGIKVAKSAELIAADMSRNEVEIDLSKFMDLLAEQSKLKDRIRELEGGVEINPWQKWIHMARAVDSWRIWPRAFLSVYIFLIYFVVMWFIDLPAPTMEQSGLISILVGAGAAWFGLYVNSASRDHAADNGK
jgi:hypothetical protein